MNDSEKKLALCNMVSRGVPMAEAKKRLGLIAPNVEEAPEEEAPEEAEKPTSIIEGTNLESLTRSQLFALIRQHNVKRPDRDRKEDLINAILEHENKLL